MRLGRRKGSRVTNTVVKVYILQKKEQSNRWLTLTYNFNVLTSGFGVFVINRLAIATDFYVFSP